MIGEWKGFPPMRVEFVPVSQGDPLAERLFTELAVEYADRYGAARERIDERDLDIGRCRAGSERNRKAQPCNRSSSRHRATSSCDPGARSMSRPASSQRGC